MAFARRVTKLDLGSSSEADHHWKDMLLHHLAAILSKTNGKRGKRASKCFQNLPSKSRRKTKTPDPVRTKKVGSIPFSRMW